MGKVVAKRADKYFMFQQQSSLLLHDDLIFTRFKIATMRTTFLHGRHEFWQQTPTEHKESDKIKTCSLFDHLTKLDQTVTG